MEDFTERWKNDKKFQTKIKLLLYVIFIVAVAIYAVIINKDSYQNITSQASSDTSVENDDTSTNSYNINIPEKYTYKVLVNIDNTEITYSGEVNETETTINKIENNETVNYLYKNNKYYEVVDENYLITSKDKIYDEIDENLLNLNAINEFVKISERKDNKYYVYMKDVILGNQSDDYFIIEINGKNIKIDYTTYLKDTGKNVNNCSIEYEYSEEE